jgi:hypothetical protein
MKPEFISMPQKGADPFFGLSRSTFYSLERDGLLRLVRVRRPGHLRGKVLIPFAETAALLQRMGRDSQQRHKGPSLPANVPR